MAPRRLSPLSSPRGHFIGRSPPPPRFLDLFLVESRLGTALLAPFPGRNPDGYRDTDDCYEGEN